MSSEHKWTEDDCRFMNVALSQVGCNVTQILPRAQCQDLRQRASPMPSRQRQRWIVEKYLLGKQKSTFSCRVTYLGENSAADSPNCP